MSRRFPVGLALVWAAWTCAFAFAPSQTLVAQADEGEYAILLADAQRDLDRGELRSAEGGFVEIVDAAEDPPDERPKPEILDAAHAGLLAIDLRRGRYDRVLDGIAELPERTREAAAVRGLHARALRATGKYEEAVAMWQQRLDRDDGDFEALYQIGETQWAAGHREAARATWAAAVARTIPGDAAGIAWRARCRWRLGGPRQLEAASHELIRAVGLVEHQQLARVTLGVLRFQVYGETANYPSGERDLLKVLELHGDVEEALLWLYRLRSSNFQLDGGKTERYLDRALRQNPNSVPALVLRGERVLDDRRYRDAAEILDEALAVDPRDKDALAHRAAAAWLLHDHDSYQALRDRALAGDSGQPDVDRILGDHLVALYRFADSKPFYEAALAVDPDHVPALHGLAKAMIYTGDGVRAKELLLHAKAQEPGFVDPWRNNALAVQALLEEEYTVVRDDHFAVHFHREDQQVLQEYLMPICLEALEVLGKKYDFRPEQQVTVEVFHTWDDFSVRTIGYRGFTALGACFGPFITLVSPGDTDLRKQDFMWEATVWHEYAHVLTLGLSKHRVPRWLTEGFSVHEEGARNKAWERGMDRELFDAFHNRDIPPVHLLNRLFRGERILFGYYQGGLIVDLIARDHGFDKAIELLRAYGDDLETEAAFERALGMSSAEFDQRFLRYVEQDKLRGMKLVPRWDEAALQQLQVRVARAPDDLDARVALAWAFLQRDNPVDAGPHLAAALQRDPDFGPALLVRARLLAGRSAMADALAHWQRGFAAGAEDFDSRIAYGRALLAAGDADGAEQQFQRAKACWPNCTEQENAPELLLAKLYRDTDRRDMALMEMKSYCRRTARAYVPRWTLAGFERAAGNRAQEARYLEECNQIDPFRRELHVRLGEAYEALDRRADAAREFEVAAAVAPALDREYLSPNAERPAFDDPGEREARGALWLRAARLRKALDQESEARALVERVRRELPGTEAAAAAEALDEEWRGR
ncbi:MAG: tetratricopeptide repeat protein [Planctomycetota bacterium]